MCLALVSGCNQPSDTQTTAASETAPDAANLQSQNQTPEATSPSTIYETSQKPDPSWLGVWQGVEGTYLEINPANIATEPTDDPALVQDYEVTIQNLDGKKTYPATYTDSGFTFERDGQTLTITRGNGEQTGMKWLADKTDCEVVTANEGYCKDF